MWVKEGKDGEGEREEVDAESTFKVKSRFF